MRKGLLAIVSLLGVMGLQAQVVLHKQHHFKKTVPAGNYSGITWLGDNRYAVVNDKSETSGFHLMTIDIDSISGDIIFAREDSFVSSNEPNRDEEGICFVPQENTLFISAEADGHVKEYEMSGSLTGRELDVPEIFKTAHKAFGLEALTYNAATKRFWTTTENTLKADGERPDIRNKGNNRLRLQSFDNELKPCEQYWYETDSSVVRKTKGEIYLGVAGMAALDDGRIIVLEREIFLAPKKVGSFVNVKLFVVNPASQQPGEKLIKTLLVEFRTKMNLTNHKFANYEGICVGRRMADGRQVLVMVADSQNQYKGLMRDWFRTVVFD
ncbi:MAG: esterase-like activity of phytase family protein [Prevotella sp.]|nr:esterase-like activity of phytase family protein [Prevotella sp.]